MSVCFDQVLTSKCLLLNSALPAGENAAVVIKNSSTLPIFIGANNEHRRTQYRNDG